MSVHESQSIVCPNCGEQNRFGRTLCWLCYAPLRRKTLQRSVPAAPIFEEDVAESYATLAVLGIALAVVCLGVTLTAPGLGIAMAILLIAPFVRTSLMIRKRAESGLPTAAGLKVLMFLGSVLFSGIVLAVVAAVAFGTFCVTCLGMAAASNDEQISVMVAAGAAFAAVCAMGYLAYRLVRWRWKKDLEK